MLLPKIGGDTATAENKEPWIAWARTMKRFSAGVPELRPRAGSSHPAERKRTHP